MRITGGKHKNRKLVVPEGKDIRPTSDRMRQSLFNMLHHSKWARHFELENARVLDLFCGSGALGLEALSHGAEHCIFVDRDISSIKNNGVFVDDGDFDIHKSNACTVKLNTSFNLVFMDPPYRQNLIEPALQNLVNQNCLANNALVIIESEKEFQSDFDGFKICDTRTQGQSALHILRYSPTIE